MVLLTQFVRDCPTNFVNQLVSLLFGRLKGRSAAVFVLAGGGADFDLHVRLVARVCEIHWRKRVVFLRYGAHRDNKRGNCGVQIFQQISLTETKAQSDKRT